MSPIERTSTTTLSKRAFVFILLTCLIAGGILQRPSHWRVFEEHEVASAKALLLDAELEWDTKIEQLRVERDRATQAAAGTSNATLEDTARNAMRNFSQAVESKPTSTKIVAATTRVKGAEVKLKEAEPFVRKLSVFLRVLALGALGGIAYSAYRAIRQESPLLSNRLDDALVFGLIGGVAALVETFTMPIIQNIAVLDPFAAADDQPLSLWLLTVPIIAGIGSDIVIGLLRRRTLEASSAG